MNEIEMPVIHIVGENATTDTVLTQYLQARGFTVRCYATATGFLALRAQFDEGCVLLDVDGEHAGGVVFSQTVTRLASVVKVICMSEHNDVSIAVRTMKAGAVDFLLKPIMGPELLRALMEIFDRLPEAGSNPSVQKVECLTEREKIILQGLAAGQRNKQIASELGLCERTIKSYRAGLMRKVGARSFAELLLRTGALMSAC